MHHNSITRALIAGLALAGGLAVGCNSGKEQSRRNKRSLRNAYVLEITSLPAPRAEATATLLGSGEVLVVGGVDGAGQPLHTTVLIAADGRTRPGPDLINPRAGHTATLLGDGQVWIAGGHRDASGIQGLRATELYHPDRGTFVPGPMLADRRSSHAAQVVTSGGLEKVLLAGGWQHDPGGATYLDSLELLDPASGTSMVLTERLPEPQAGLQAALLDSGEVVLAGGTGTEGPATPARFDPSTNTVAPVLARRERVGAAVASVGSCALVVGGTTEHGVEADIEIHRPGADEAFRAERTLSTPRTEATAARVGDALVVAGGRTASGALSERVELIRDCGATIVAWYPLQLPRWGHTAVAVGNLVLLIGGYDERGIPLRSIEAIDLNQPTPVTQLSPDAASLPASPAPSTPTPTQPGAGGPIAPTNSGSVVLGR